jgi:cell wall-associated NlpC family hydrolase
MASHRAPKVSNKAAAYTVVGLTAGTVALVPNLSQAAPAPTYDQVKAEVHNLDAQSDTASQQYDAAQVQYAQLQQKIDGLQEQITTESGDLRVLQTSMGLQASAQYENGDVSPTLQLALDASPDAFLTQASAAGETASQDVVKLKEINQAEVALKQDQANATALLAQEQAALKQAATIKATIQSELQKAQQLLNTLTPAQQAQVEGPGGSGTYSTVAPPVSGRAGAAIAYAESKVGRAQYEVGATGPDYYDCSGLVMASWASAGVQIERDSMEQWASLPHISESELEPGDLVFYYPGPSGPGHVAMYIGNGQIVQALHQGTYVMNSPMLGEMPLVGFARVV